MFIGILISINTQPLEGLNLVKQPKEFDLSYIIKGIQKVTRSS
jgi:hypothetical protein